MQCKILKLLHHFGKFSSILIPFPIIHVIDSFYTGFIYSDSTNCPNITLNEEGVFLHGYNVYGRQKKEIKWDSIQSVRIDRNAISLKNNIGSTEKVKLPIHTKEQIAQLKSYLEQLAEKREIEYGV